MCPLLLLLYLIIQPPLRKNLSVIHEMHLSWSRTMIIPTPTWWCEGPFFCQISIVRYISYLQELRLWNFNIQPRRANGEVNSYLELIPYPPFHVKVPFLSPPYAYDHWDEAPLLFQPVTHFLTLPVLISLLYIISNVGTHRANIRIHWQK